MGQWIDLAVCFVVVATALGFLARRFRLKRTPSCAPSANAKPRVLMGSRLTAALENQKRAAKP